MREARCERRQRRMTLSCYAVTEDNKTASINETAPIKSRANMDLLTMTIMCRQFHELDLRYQDSRRLDHAKSPSK